MIIILLMRPRERIEMNTTNCYGCNTPIYWNPVKGEYWEVYKNKKHKCPYLEKLQEIRQ